jgi:predicted XRE-type DNA-binding protein
MALNEQNEGKRERARLNEETIRFIKKRLQAGHFQHDIAADLGINQGRVSEVKTGKRGLSDSDRQPALF